MGKKTIAINSIRRDDTQTRAALNSERVADYAERLKAGDDFPPPVVFFDEETHWLADGFHRVEAHVQNGRARIECELRKGGRFDAIVFGVGANAKHGLHRSNADKRHSVRMMFEALAEKDESWSNSRIAEVCGVRHPLVADVRAEVELEESSSSPKPRTGSDGRIDRQRRNSLANGSRPIEAAHRGTSSNGTTLATMTSGSLTTWRHDVCR